MDYDKIFENDIDRKFFYTDYPGDKMMVGRISLKNAQARLDKNEYYTLVTYSEQETLPEQYIPLHDLPSEDGTKFATINPNIDLWNICRDGGIQRITKLFSSEYLLGPGPDKVSLTDIILDQYEKYTESKKQVVAEQQRNQELGQMIAENNQSNIIVNQTASQK